jgi:hypothetical protein
MSKVLSFDDFNNISEDVIVAGFGPDYLRSFSLSTTLPTTGYSMKPIVGYIKEMCTAAANEAYSYESNNNPKHKGIEYLTEVKKCVSERLDEMYEMRKNVKENLSVNEAEEYEFDPQETDERLRNREEMNIRRFRAAQERQDNFAIEYYQLRIKIDKIEREKLKVQTAIHDLKKQFKKDEQ